MVEINMTMTMLRTAWVLGLASCGGPTPVPTTPAQSTGSGSAAAVVSNVVPTAAFVISHDNVLDFAEVSPSGVKVTRSVSLPAYLLDVAWVGPDPVVLLSENPDDETVVGGEVGLVTAKGYVPYPRVPDKTWAAKAPADLDHFEVPEWQLVVTANNEVWQGRCEYGYFGDGDECTEWRYVQLSPKAGIVQNTAPKAAPRFALPTIAASKTTTLALAAVTPEPYDDGTKRDPYKVLRCTAKGEVVEWPEADGRDSFHGVTKITWLRTEPPMYQVTYLEDGLDVHETELIFTGCAPAEGWADAAIEPGPQELYALRNYESETTAVHWRGNEVGKLEGIGGMVRFAPLAR